MQNKYNKCIKYKNVFSNYKNTNMRSHAIEHWPEISFHNVGGRDTQISNQLLNSIFIRYTTYEYGIICIDVRAQNTGIGD